MSPADVAAPVAALVAALDGNSIVTRSISNSFLAPLSGRSSNLFVGRGTGRHQDLRPFPTFSGPSSRPIRLVITSPERGNGWARPHSIRALARRSESSQSPFDPFIRRQGS